MFTIPSLESRSITSLKGVGPKLAEKLQRLKITTLQDLFFHLPHRYQDRTRIASIGHCRIGDACVIQGSIENTHVVFHKRRSMLCKIKDDTGTLTLRFFHFSAAQQKILQQGKLLRCYGEIRRGPNSFEMVHPEYKIVSEDDALNPEDGLTPIYPTTEGVQQLTLRKLTDQLMVELDRSQIPDLIPETLLPSSLQIPLKEALRTLHRPVQSDDYAQLLNGNHPARQRLAFEELLAHRISMRALRHQQQIYYAPRMDGERPLYKKLRHQLPFTLTNAQARVVDEINADLSTSQPMLRLVQGDVGSGKTVVAALAAAIAVDHGYQVAMMAPTEILAEQHRINFERWFTPLGIDTAWLSGKLTTKQRSDALARIANGSARIVIGTHALFQEHVQFEALGLSIIDEQHRFGVDQRLALRDKGVQNGIQPHQLTLTATPIPRTLAMTAYADLDCSIIDELPPGRKPIVTAVLPGTRRDEIITRIQESLHEGRQAYWVCTLIEESEVLECQAAEETANYLTQSLADCSVGLVHGRMKPAEKEAVMQDFKAGTLQLLVATTVIEVGVDVPNASMMVIENAERLGLSQLHQLRGRVGRGEYQSSCVLLYTPPLSLQGKERLKVMRDTNDGFIIAEKDLELRGAGELLGTKQTGQVQFRIADLSLDAGLLEPVRDSCQQLLTLAPENSQALLDRWIGDTKDYSHV